jgi:ABC-type multidrug transport system fused ATPase/permease subunit
MIVQALVDIKNLGELLSEHPDITDDVGATPYPAQGTSSTGLSIEFKDVDFHYPEQPPEKGIRSLSISVPPGSCTAVVGPTGAGKTSLSRLLFRFYDPKAGGVLIGGRDVRKHTQQSVRKLIGIVPQDTVLFNDTIAYNIRYGRMDATQEEIEAAAESAQIKTFIESLPEGWNTVVGERGLKLSGGEKQRVSIARCLLKNPPIVLLDEATSALDTVTENSVQDALDALGTNRTTIIIAHRLSTIRQASQIIVLEAGQVAESGSFEELLAKGGKFAGLWEMQNRRGVDSSKVVSTEEVAVSAV